MKIQVKAEEFRREFGFVSRNAGGAKTPILNNVVGEVLTGGALVLSTCSDRGTFLHSRVVCFGDTQTAQTFVLPLKRVAAILKECEAEDVTIVVDGDVIRMEFGRSKFRLQSTDSAEFPQPSFKEPIVLTSVPSQPLSAALSHCSSVTDQESTRYALGAVAIDYTDNECLVFVGTDTRQLVVRRVSHTLSERRDATEDSGMCKIGRAECGLLHGLCEVGETVSLHLGSESWQASSGNRMARGATVDGRLPAYRNVIPEEQRTPLVAAMLVTELLRGCRLSQITTTQESVGVRLSFRDDGLRMHHQASDIGESVVNVVCDTFLQHETILDINRLKAMCTHARDAETITLRQDGEGAARFDFGGGALHVIMPIANE